MQSASLVNDSRASSLTVEASFHEDDSHACRVDTCEDYVFINCVKSLQLCISWLEILRSGPKYFNTLSPRTDQKLLFLQIFL